MTAQRFVHRRLTSTEFTNELANQNLSLPAFTRIWCQNLSTTTRWANGQNEIPTWVPIALTLMRVPGAMVSARTAAGAMIEMDTLNPQWGKFPYSKTRSMPEDDEVDA